MSQTNAPSIAGRLISDAYRDWKKYGHHLEEYASEFAGTAFLVFCVVGAVGLMFAKGSPVPTLISPLWLRLLLTGLMLGGAGWIVALTPPGKLSGAHLNPAVSVGFWVLRKMHLRDMLAYILAQLAGGCVGALFGRWTFASLAAQTNSAALQPAPSLSFLATAGAEFAASLGLVFVILTCVSHKPLVHWTPAIATLAVGLLVLLDGNFSGCGMNPARWIGPAALSSTWTDWPAYAIAPLLGGAAAALLRRPGWLGNPLPHTAKRLHDPRYRSIFRFDTEPSTPPPQTSPNTP